MGRKCVPWVLNGSVLLVLTGCIVENCIIGRNHELTFSYDRYPLNFQILVAFQRGYGYHVFALMGLT